jgi:shikimate dehydrogenase
MGNPVAHSLSPRIHHAFAEQTGERIYYQALLVPPDGFEAALERFQALGGKGLNITVPFKQEAWRAATIRSGRAERAGAVNTLWFDDDGRRHGDTTDGTGLVRDLQRHAVVLDGRRVLILGAGGAVRGVLGELLEQHPANLLIANRTPARAEELVRGFGTPSGLRATGFDHLDSAGGFDVIINAIPAGLTAELPPLPPGLLAAGCCCYDMVYGSGDTPFVAWARGHGAGLALDGLGMLVEQAAESFYIWRGLRPETEPVIAMLRNS